MVRRLPSSRSSSAQTAAAVSTKRARCGRAVAVAVPGNGDDARRCSFGISISPSSRPPDPSSAAARARCRRLTATSACTVWLWSERKTKFSGRLKFASSCASVRQCLWPISSSSAISRVRRRRSAIRAAASRPGRRARTDRAAARRTRTARRRAAGRRTSGRARRARRAPSSSVSSADSVSVTFTCGHAFEEAAHHVRAGSAGRRSGRPRRGACRPGLPRGPSGRPGPRRRAPRWRPHGVSSSRPASVRDTGFGPPGRSTSRWPTIRSRAAICWLTADWV